MRQILSFCRPKPPWTINNLAKFNQEVSFSPLSRQRKKIWNSEPLLNCHSSPDSSKLDQRKEKEGEKAGIRKREVLRRISMKGMKAMTGMIPRKRERERE